MKIDSTNEPTKKVPYKPRSLQMLDQLLAAQPQITAIEVVGERNEKLVCRGVHATAGRVILKALLRGADPQRRRRMLHEIAVYKSLGQCAFCPRFVAGGEINGAPYLVIEEILGESLARRLARKGALPVGEAASLIQRASRAVAQLHARGLVHRDLQPSHIFICEDGQVKIIDFELAQAPRQAPVQSFEILPLTLAEVAGSPSYMSPEQLLSASLADERADAYTLGCALWECLSGSPPFLPHGDDLIALVETKRRPLPLDTLGVPAALAAVLAEVLAPDPADRFASLSDLAQALAPFVFDALHAVFDGAPQSGGEPPPPEDPPIAHALDPSAYLPRRLGRPSFAQQLGALAAVCVGGAVVLYGFQQLTTAVALAVCSFALARAALDELPTT